MNACTEIWEYEVLYKYQALLLPDYNGRMQSWKKTNDEFKAEGLKLMISEERANLAWDVCVV